MRWIKSLCNLLSTWWELLDKWTRKPRVRLLPFYFTRLLDKDKLSQDGFAETCSGILIANSGLHANSKWSDFRRDIVEDHFYELINSPPQFCAIITQYFAGYFNAKSDGIEEPNTDIMMMWPMSACGGDVGTYVFFFDDQYFAGDIIPDSTTTYYNCFKPPVTFYIRFLFKIREMKCSAEHGRTAQ